MLLAGRDIDVELVLNQLEIDEGIEVNYNIVTQCPWPENHASGDAHPSFSISLKSGAWLCYAGCASGGLVSLVKRILELDDAAARRWILQAGGTVNFAEQPWAQFGGLPEQGEDGVEVARADYSLMDGTATSSYFLDRGFTMQTIKDWGIRYDRHLEAIVIPMHDLYGNLVGTIRRMVPPIRTHSKYLYNKHFDRSKHLFGAYRHPRTGPTIVTEGPLDALWLHQYGYSTAVALMGSYCSNRQIDLMLQVSHSVVLVMDGDEPGREATAKLEQQLAGRIIASSIALPEGKDVQDLPERELFELLGMYKTPLMR